MKRQSWTDERNEWLAEHYVNLTNRDIAQRLGRSMEAVKQQAHKLGLTKYPDDISFFENWSAESAYIIGLFAADGYAQNRPGRGVALSISQKEKEILERIQALVGRGNLYYIWQNDSYRYELHSRKLYEFLNGVFGHDVQAKSRTLQWPTVPGQYERDFIRGYCDGDGHVSLDGRGAAQIRLCSGSECFRDGLLAKVADLTGIRGTTALTINDLYLALYSSIKAVCLAKWLYRPGDLAMERKREAARELAAQEQNRINKDSLTPTMRRKFPTILGRHDRETANYLLAD